LNTTALIATPSTPKEERRGSDDSYGIVVFSHLRWNFVWQRPQQFLSRFASRHPVLFVEEPDFRLADDAQPTLLIENAAPNVTTATVAFPRNWRGRTEVPSILRGLTQQAIDTVNAEGAFDEPLLWYYSPTEASWSLGFFPARGVVYDCMDELSQFRGAPADLIENERCLMEEADIVFTGGYELWAKKSRQHANCHFFGCGVEYDHFAQAQNDMTTIPEDVRKLPRPIVGWFGVIDERMDYELLQKAADLRPDWSFVLVGPIVKVDPADLPKNSNIHWIGGRDYRVLPNYCRAFDVCMMPFALNEATEYINPTKALEYLATGKPVVGTPVRDVVRQYADTISIVNDADQFVAAVEKALAGADRAMTRRGIEKAREASWERTVERMQDLIAQAIETKSEAYVY
jgi:glycosyltransferase involved in cell wall biosynthesis